MTEAQIPAHNHTAQTASGGELNNPANHTWSNWPGAQYSPNQAGFTTMNPAALGAAGGSQPHDNLPPYLALNFIISMFGIFPSPV